MAVYPCACTKGAAASSHLISRLSCSLPRSNPYGGVCVTLLPWSDTCELGSSAASSGPEIYCGVRCYTMWARPHYDFTKPAVLHHIEWSGTGHWVPDNSHCCACKWTKKSHVREGTHRYGYSTHLSMQLWVWVLYFRYFRCWGSKVLHLLSPHPIPSFKNSHSLNSFLRIIILRCMRFPRPCCITVSLWCSSTCPGWPPADHVAASGCSGIMASPSKRPERLLADMGVRKLHLLLLKALQCLSLPALYNRLDNSHPSCT